MSKLTLDHNLAISVPFLASQWHPTKNRTLAPSDVTPNSGKKVWWICSSNHEWQAVIASRKDGVGCPFCSNRQVHPDNCLTKINPEITKEWHPTKNSSLTPNDVVAVSGKKIWWLCEKGHEWQATVVNRAKKGSGCPYCVGQLAHDENCLDILNPKLASEWHPSKNGLLTTRDVLPNANKEAWWLCKNGHEWQQKIVARNNSKGCPYCGKRRSTAEYSLQVLNPKLASEWHSTKNGTLTPRDILPNAHKKVWWRCIKNHEWQASVERRNQKGSGCLRCARQRVYQEDSLEIRNPLIVREWHPIKNGSLTPREVTSGSSRKVWWICANGHEWEALVANRVKKNSGCPYCTGQRAHGDDCLAVRNPQLASEWHLTKNGTLTPRDILPNAHKNVWWLCKKGHEWEERIDARNRSNECPYCARSRPTAEYSLQTINPKLASEWHPTKNGVLTPVDALPGSNKKAWWLCKKGHEWSASIYERNVKGSGCPRCFSQTSFPELLIYSEMKYLYKNVEHRKKHAGVECDIFIPDIKVAIEIDGIYWHKNKERADADKTNTLRKAGIFVIRVREKGLPKITDNDIAFSSSTIGFGVVQEVIVIILKSIETSEEQKQHLNEYLQKGILANQDELVKLMDMLPSPLPGCSLADKNKNIAQEWHPTKNGTLTPNDVAPNSAKKVWWQCKKGHEWQAILANRNKSRGCPYCGGSLPTPENCLQVLNPQLASEWHPTKNGAMTPSDILPNSRKTVWWICSNGHEWQAFVVNRTSGTGCPYCSTRILRADNSLHALNPKMASQWHPTKNGKLTPRDVFSSAARKAWWRCDKGHEWQVSINSRSNRGSGCPYCNGKFASTENCLQAVNPELAKEWHPSKNGVLTPRDILPNSNKKIWWICSKGHEWQAAACTRNNGHGCQKCYGLSRKKPRVI